MVYKGRTKSDGPKTSKSGKGKGRETDPNQNDRDIVIPVMGPTGVGKSTFINTVLGQNRMTVGKEIESCTTDIASADIGDLQRLFPQLHLLHGRRVLLVDTPGFDDTYQEDSVILERIAKWLKDSYRTQVMGGVIYLHDISIDRYTGSAKKNLVMFNRLCGEGALDKVVLGTTKASRLSPDEATKRLSRLKEAHWKDMTNNGARVIPFDGNRGSALNLVGIVLKQFGVDIALEIQRELVVAKKIIPETEAGKELRYTLQQVLEHQKRYAQLSETAGTPGDPAAEADLLEAKQQIEKLRKQLQDLKVPFMRRWLPFLSK